MSPTTTVKIAESTYESVEAICPWCDRRCVFNRASDLRTFELIWGREVSCLQADCGKSFRIAGDSANSAHEMLIYDCVELLQQKRYMSCILNLTQAYEVFFSLFFRVELLYKPFAAEDGGDLDALNQVAAQLEAALKRNTFGPLRARFLDYFVNRSAPLDLQGAAALMRSWPMSPAEPTRAAVEGIADGDLAPLLQRVKATTIHELRNAVVHRRAYRPRREEVVAALEDARSTLFPLTAKLDLCDDVNWYRNRAPQR